MKERVRHLRAKLVAAPLAVVFLAGAFASLPTSAGWPLHHGFGGVLGDAALGMLAGFLAPINPDRAAAAAGLFYFAAGLMALIASLGLTQADLKQICNPPRGDGLTRLAGMWRGLGAYVRTRREPLLEMPADRSTVSIADEPPARAREEQAAIVLEVASASDTFGTGRGDWFDRHTERTSRVIAQRFAPGMGGRIEPTLGDLPDEDMGLASVAAPQPAEGAYRRPPLSLLKRPPVARTGGEATEAALRGQMQLLADVLKDFGITGEIKHAHPGPVVTLFEFEPARGIKTSRVLGLADDVARSMSAAGVRVAVVPGRSTIGIELPSPRREKVYLRELLEAEAFRSADAALPLALGKGISGAPVVADLARMPHLLVAGTTGSGKSVAINGMILSLLFRLTPDRCRLLLIDPKMLELSVYNGIPHLLCPVVTDPDQAVSALEWAVREMEQRYERMAKLGVRNIDVFNNRVRTASKRADVASRMAGSADLVPMPHIVVAVDEFADLMLVAGKEVEASVKRLAQMARAAGMHLIMATQRPSVDVVTGTIKANFPSRISFKVPSKFDSRTILNEQGAEQLLGQGDMLFSSGGRQMRVHGPFVSDEEVEGIAAYLRAQGEPSYIDGITDASYGRKRGAARASDEAEDLYDRAVAIVLRDRAPSTSYLRQCLSVHYDCAAALIQRMEREGIVSAAGRDGRRTLLIPPPSPSRP
jgi:S-DNA-T family DNA segregation ATPase FtsK/SpoIIIE